MSTNEAAEELESGVEITTETRWTPAVLFIGMPYDEEKGDLPWDVEELAAEDDLERIYAAVEHRVWLRVTMDRRHPRVGYPHRDLRRAGMTETKKQAQHVAQGTRVMTPEERAKLMLYWAHLADEKPPRFMPHPMSTGPLDIADEWEHVMEIRPDGSLPATASDADDAASAGQTVPHDLTGLLTMPDNPPRLADFGEDVFDHSDVPDEVVAAIEAAAGALAPDTSWDITIARTRGSTSARGAVVDGSGVLAVNVSHSELVDRRRPRLVGRPRPSDGPILLGEHLATAVLDRNDGGDPTKALVLRLLTDPDDDEFALVVPSEANIAWIGEQPWVGFERTDAVEWERVAARGGD